MNKKTKPFNNPFAAVGKELKKQIKANKKAEMEASLVYKKPQPPKPKKKKKGKQSLQASDDLDPADVAVFARYMKGASPLADDDRGAVRPKLPPADASNARVHDEEEEVLLELASLVDGTATFDISDTDEFMEGAIEGLDSRILRKLRTGHYAIQAHLDLHGLTREPAKEEVSRFIAASRTAGPTMCPDRAWPRAELGRKGPRTQEPARSVAFPGPDK